MKVEPFYLVRQVMEMTGWSKDKTRAIFRKHGYQIGGKHSAWMIDKEKLKFLRGDNENKEKDT